MRIVRQVNWPDIPSLAGKNALQAAGAVLEVVRRTRKALQLRDAKIARAINAGHIEVVDAVPTDPPEYEGVGVKIYDDGSTTRTLYVWVNDAWRYVALT